MGRGVERPGPRVERKCAPFACGVFSILHEATRPRIVIDPASGLIKPLSIFNSVVLPAPVMPNQPQALMPSPPGVRPLGCTKAFLRNLFFGPSQGPQFPAA